MTRPPQPSPAEAALAAARAVLLDNRRGVALADERPLPVFFVPDPSSGDIVLRLPRTALDAEQIVLNVPDEGDDALMLLLHVVGAADERGAPVAPDITPHGVDEALIDRWRIVHGDPPASPARRDVKPELQVYVRSALDTARHHGMVYEGELFAIKNILASDEPRLCKRANADRARLDRAIRAVLGAHTENALCVSVDQRGVLLRTPLGIIRAPFPSEAAIAPEAEGHLAAFLARGDADVGGAAR